MAETGRPESKNVFYFPHYTKSNRELDLIEYRHKSEGYRAYYKLLEMVADADYHRLSIKSQDEKDMFDIGMNSNQEVVTDVINILVNKGRIDRELWENEKVIWMGDFVETLKPVYSNRHKPLPQKDGINRVSTDSNSISTGSNTQKRKEKKIKEKRNKDPLPLSEYKELYDWDIQASYDKCIKYYDDSPAHEQIIKWLDGEKKKPLILKQYPSGLYKAYCDICGKLETPDDKQLKFPSTACCRSGYVPAPSMCQNQLNKRSDNG